MKNIIDLLNAKSDLEKKIIKTVGNPKYRLKEDSLRILRAIRFATILNLPSLNSNLLNLLFFLLYTKYICIINTTMIKAIVSMRDGIHKSIRSIKSRKYFAPNVLMTAINDITL